MTWMDFLAGRELNDKKTSKAALLMALFAEAENDELKQLGSLYPGVLSEYIARLNTKNGRLSGDK